MASQGGFLKERLELCSMLWKNKIPAELLYKNKPQMKNQLAKAAELGCPFAIIIGESEVANGIVQIKNLKKGFFYFTFVLSWFGLVWFTLFYFIAN